MGGGLGTARPTRLNRAGNYEPGTSFNCGAPVQGPLPLGPRSGGQVNSLVLSPSLSRVYFSVI